MNDFRLRSMHRNLFWCRTNKSYITKFRYGQDVFALITWVHFSWTMTVNARLCSIVFLNRGQKWWCKLNRNVTSSIVYKMAHTYKYWYQWKDNFKQFLGHRSQRLQWPIVIMRCPASVVRRPSSVVRLSSVVRRPLDYLHFRLLLQNRLMDFDETWYSSWYSRSLTSVVVFRPDPSRGGSRAGQK